VRARDEVGAGECGAMVTQCGARHAVPSCGTSRCDACAPGIAAVPVAHSAPDGDG